MNILLTDLNSLNLDLPEMPVLPPETGEDFTRLMQQQLPTETEIDPQLIEFEEFFSGLSMPQEVPTGLPQKAAETWRDYLSQQQIRVTTDPAAAPLTPLVSTAAAVQVVQAPSVAAEPVAPVTGAELPDSGKSLPPAANISAEIELKRTDVSQPRTLAPAANAVAADAGARSVAAAQTSVPRTVAPAGSEIPPEAPIKIDKIEPVSTVKPPPPLPARVAAMQQTSPQAVNAAVDLGGQPVPRQIDAVELPLRTAVPSNPVGTTLAADKPSNPGATAQPLPLAVTGKVAFPNDAEPRPAREAAAARQVQAPESISARLPSAPAGAVAVDSARPVETQLTPPAMTQAAKPAAEAAAAATEAPQRAPEITSGNGSNQSQPTPAPQATMQPVAMTNTGAPVNPAPTALPPHLESMTLARNAEPAAWGEGLGDRVNWMINQKQNSALIRLDPPMLGKLEVQVKLADDATSITIHTQHAQTRELIETASVRLRDYLQESGFQNVNVDVSQRQDQQQARAQDVAEEFTEEQSDAQAEAESDQQHMQASAYSVGEGLLDTFA